MKERYALLSVFDKTGIVDFAKVLVKLGYKIISSSGTAKTLLENNLPVIPIQEITGHPEVFDGRIKTISLQIEGGILFDRHNPKHVSEAEKFAIKPIDIVVCNLYPFEKEPSIGNIDVGGPTMIRAAAKNFEDVLVIVDPADYQKISRLLLQGKITSNLRQALAAKAFYHLSLYDSLIASFLNKKDFPKEMTIPLRQSLKLRYGENPHQQGFLYLDPFAKTALKNLQKIAGRQLSLVNILDINAGIEAVRIFKEPAAVVIKHGSPCGIALGEDISLALQRAIEADPESAFGGVVVVNRPVNKKVAKIIGEFKEERRGNIDIFAAPKFAQQAIKFLISVRKSMGIYSCAKILKPRKSDKNIKFIDGGVLIQNIDYLEDNFEGWQVVTKRKPTKTQLEQMKVGWKFISRIRSNAVIVVDKKLPMTRGIGSGQTSRVRSTKIALEQAGKYAQGAILVSDSFFPFDDSVKLAAKYKIGAIIQQGGSINDKASIEAAERAGIPMVFTNRRAFWH